MWGGCPTAAFTGVISGPSTSELDAPNQRVWLYNANTSRGAFTLEQCRTAQHAVFPPDFSLRGICRGRGGGL